MGIRRIASNSGERKGRENNLLSLKTLSSRCYSPWELDDHGDDGDDGHHDDGHHGW